MADFLSEMEAMQLQQHVNHNTKSLIGMQKTNERQASAMELMEIVLSGSLAFDLLDRMGPNLPSDDWFVPEWRLAWLAISVAVFGFFAFALHVLLNYMTRRTAGLLNARATWNLKVNLNGLERYLARKKIQSEEVDLAVEFPLLPPLYAEDLLDT